MDTQRQSGSTDQAAFLMSGPGSRVPPQLKQEEDVLSGLSTSALVLLFRAAYHSFELLITLSSCLSLSMQRHRVLGWRPERCVLPRGEGGRKSNTSNHCSS